VPTPLFPHRLRRAHRNHHPLAAAAACRPYCRRLTSPSSPSWPVCSIIGAIIITPPPRTIRCVVFAQTHLSPHHPQYREPSNDWSPSPPLTRWVPAECCRCLGGSWLGRTCHDRSTQPLHLPINHSQLPQAAPQSSIAAAAAAVIAAASHQHHLCHLLLRRRG